MSHMMQQQSPEAKLLQVLLQKLYVVEHEFLTLDQQQMICTVCTGLRFLSPISVSDRMFLNFGDE